MLPALIAGSWFGASGARAIATSLGVVANQLGTFIGMGSTILNNFVHEDVEDGPHSIDLGMLQSYIGRQLFVAIVAVLVVVMFGADRPVTPPSQAVAALDLCCGLGSSKRGESNDVRRSQEEAPLFSSAYSRRVKCERTKGKQQVVETTPSASIGYIESVKMVAMDPKHVAFCPSECTTRFQPFWAPSWPPQWIGWLGFPYQVAGVLGSLASGLVVDSTGQPRRVGRALLLRASLSFFLMLSTFALAEKPSRNGPSAAAPSSSPSPFASVDIGIVVGVIMLAGMTLAAWNFVGMEFGKALAYPACEAAMAGVLECASELLGFV